MARTRLAAIAACAFGSLMVAPSVLAGPSRGATEAQTPVVSAFSSPLEAARFLAGPGVTVSNAAWRGDVGIGGFSGAQAEVGFDAGALLTSGFRDTIFRPNLYFETTGVHQGADALGDPDLDSMSAPYATFDAAVLEFDVTTDATTIGIRYVFSSEEFNEWVGWAYNDVFAIFVNGVNCALVGAKPVSVDTINLDSNLPLFVDNTGSVREIEMDGLTVDLTCTAQVTPGVPNHVKLAVADVAAPLVDSVAFVAAHGIVPGGPPQPGARAPAVEYIDATFGHFCFSSKGDEIAALDNGTISGWRRTGESFTVWTGGAGLVDVCRFFTPAFAPKVSHFYTATGAECAWLRRNPIWIDEGLPFRVALPAAAGHCPTGVRLYRLYNNGQTGAPNHRYTTSPAIREQMIGQGFVPEDTNDWCVAN